MVFPLNPTAHRNERLTDDEFYAFCQANAMLRLERDETGQVWFRLPRYTKLSILAASLLGEIGIWNRSTKPGFVYDSNGGFTLPDTSVRAPDVSWISRERWDALSTDEQEKFAPICPDFVIELMSDRDEKTGGEWYHEFQYGFVIELMSDRDEKYTLPAKMEKYFRNGVRLAWMVDPFSQQTTIYRPDREPETQPFTEPLSGEDVLPGFALRLSEIV